MNNRRFHSKSGLIAVALTFAAAGRAQTVIDLRTQSKSVDFSQAISTRPSKTGGTLPATCLTGETFFKTDASAGQNLYGCVATNLWSLLGGGQSLPGMGGQNNRVLSNDGSTAAWRAVGQGLRMDTGGLAIDTSSVPLLTATNTFSGRQTMNGGLNGAGAMDFSQAASTKPNRVGSVDPGTCSAGETFFNTTGGQQKICAAQNTWVSLGAGGGGGGTTYWAGTGIAIASDVISVDTASVPYYLSGSASLDFPSIANGACAVATFSLPGAQTGNAVAAAWPSTLESGLIGMMSVTANGTVSVRLCNLSGGSIDPANQTFGAAIVGSF